ncbi:MAG: energy-coupling factor transporter transmembrane protein EcfT [Synergistaceae bacterium]|nr:energy-coupling factor transporter transmembrane protein EcfT [Synergistaceae bacterium]
MRGFLDYVSGDSVPHRLNPMTKLALAFVLCAACFMTKDHMLVGGVIVCNLCLAAMAGVFDRSARVFLSLLKLAFILFVMQVFFVRQGNVLLTLPKGFYITDEGISFSLLFAMRMIAAAMPLTLMLSITRMSDLSNALVKFLHIPYKYTFVLTTAIRFIPLFSDEMIGIMEAQTARGVEFDTRSFIKKVRLLLPLCVPLLISSVRRIETGAISAELRGFNLRTRDSGYKTYGFGAIDAAAFVFCALLIYAALTV